MIPTILCAEHRECSNAENKQTRILARWGILNAIPDPNLRRKERGEEFTAFVRTFGVVRRWVGVFSRQGEKTQFRGIFAGNSIAV